MALVELFKNFRDKYMRSSIEKLDFPDFPPDEERRYEIIFSVFSFCKTITLFMSL